MKVKDKAAMAARKRERKLNIETISLTKIIVVNDKIVAPIKTIIVQTQSQGQADDLIKIKEQIDNHIPWKEAITVTSLKTIKSNITLAIRENDIIALLEINRAIHYALSNKHFATNEIFKARQYNEAVSFIAHQFAKMQMTWNIAKMHMNNHFQLGILVNVPKADARV